MGYNKDEAVRAKEIAERKFTEKDYNAAKKFALKAQNLYPELDGLTKMLTTFDVLISAETRISNGEVDWYKVLGVNPWADLGTIKKQYRKLALILHPDRKNSHGADSAFNLISEAWNLLSDKARRLEYNQKLSMLVSQQGASTQNKVQSAAPGANGFHSGNNSVNLNARTHKKTTPRAPATIFPPNRKTDTFWTICNHCKTQYEYLRIYLNHNLLCPNCHEAFFAEEKTPPPNVMNSSNDSFRQKNENSLYHTAGNGGIAQGSACDMFTVRNLISDPDLQGNHYSKTGTAGSTFPSVPTIAQASGLRGHSHHRVKREHEKAEEMSSWNGNCASKKTGNSVNIDQLYKKRRSNEACKNDHEGAGLGNLSEPRKGSCGTRRFYSFSGINNMLSSERDLTAVEVRKMLTAKALSSIRKKLEEWSSNPVKQRENEEQACSIDGCEKYDGSDVLYKKNKRRKSLPNDSNKKSTALLSINVPDPDFHNFDLDRTENSFGGDDVWAVYDDTDGMPRYYARIHEVISLTPFKMKISWLNSRNTAEFGALNWVDSGFHKTCGDFRTGKHEISKTLNSFSHKVKWTKCRRGVIRILPKKGDIWALYRNWSPDWNENTPVEVVHKYDMVEVVDDYDDEQGISVIPLIKAAGFKTVFHNSIDPSAPWRIPKQEMFRFSHQVPDHLLTGEEADNAPKGCRELDPAATPVDLLQVAEANEAQMETRTKADRQMGQDIPKDKVDQNVGNCAVVVEPGSKML
ncbi:hypothetical protein K2173_008629 [Erythroxylum novogranatense]|uniref:J domain-containing protein n=1 Tax=Erythroxylum novogranatense TaxID=1862640 RepID=A0AAV8SLM4_9ROSI|nr:hypothetical protein K2173_008629 [Erythroxylum novogranatense]